MGPTSIVGWLKMAKENVGSLESLVKETEPDVTGTGAASGLEVCLRKPGSSIQKLVPSLGATAIIPGGDNKGLNKGDCCGGSENEKRYCEGSRDFGNWLAMEEKRREK